MNNTQKIKRLYFRGIVLPLLFFTIATVIGFTTDHLDSFREGYGQMVMILFLFCGMLLACLLSASMFLVSGKNKKKDRTTIIITWITPAAIYDLIIAGRILSNLDRGLVLTEKMVLAMVAAHLLVSVLTLRNYLNS